MPVVESYAVGLRELAGRETLHAGSVGVLVSLVMVEKGMSCLMRLGPTHASATQFRKFGPDLENRVII